MSLPGAEKLVSFGELSCRVTKSQVLARTRVSQSHVQVSVMREEKPERLATAEIGMVWPEREQGSGLGFLLLAFDTG